MADINIERIAIVHEISSTITLERIIRCKKCQHYNDETHQCDEWKKATEKDGFCFRGKFRIGERI